MRSLGFLWILLGIIDMILEVFAIIPKSGKWLILFGFGYTWVMMGKRG